MYSEPSILCTPLGVIFIRVISLLVKSSSLWEMWMSGITHPEIRDKFGKCNVYTKEACKDCFARFYCSGGCAANAYHFQKDINGNYGIGCELQRKRVECAIMIKAALAE